MPRELFEEVVNPAVRLGSKQWYVLPLSILAHTVAIAVAIIIPLMAADILPTPPSMMAFVSAAPPPPPPPPPPPQAAPPPKVEVQVNPGAAPIEAPSEIRAETGLDAQFEKASVVGGVEGGLISGIVGGLEPPPPPPPPPVAPVRVGGNIKPPTQIKRVNPVYPPIAQSARVQGVVIIEAVIGPGGQIQDARILRSIPLLDQAALDAVRQWEYTPTLLNGVPVPVIMTVTVNFTLQ